MLVNYRIDSDEIYAEYFQIIDSIVFESTVENKRTEDSKDEEPDMSNLLAQMFIENTLKNRNLLLFEKFDQEIFDFKSIKLIDINLESSACDEALRKLKAFERIP